MHEAAPVPARGHVLGALCPWEDPGGPREGGSQAAWVLPKDLGLRVTATAEKVSVQPKISPAVACTLEDSQRG